MSRRGIRAPVMTTGPASADVMRFVGRARPSAVEIAIAMSAAAELGGAPSFDAGDVATDLRFWYRGDAFEVSSGVALVELTDLSGNDQHATQIGASGNQPTSIPANAAFAGKPTFRFDGLSQFMYLPDLSDMDGAEGMLVVKLANDPTVANKNGLWHIGTDENATYYALHANDLIYDQFGTDARKNAIADPSPALTSAHIYNVTSINGEWTARLWHAGGGGEIYTTATNVAAFSAAPYLGRDFSGGIRLDGDVAEFAMFEDKLSTEDRAALVAALKTEYGIS